MKTPTLRSPWFLYVATMLVAASAFAQSSEDDLAPTQLDDVVLEGAFWDCDVLATREAVSLAAGAECVRLSDELKQRRFGGDFEQFLAWWRENKAREHALRDDTAADPLDAP